MSSMRGLTIFISDIRNATSKEDEAKRVEKELAHIRKQFSDKNIDGYGLKKYIWKLLYMYMLGYDIEVGHMEALKLITSNKFSEKNGGYMACQLLWNENTEFLRLLVQTIKKDLTPQNEIFQSLALSFIANIGGQEFAESLAVDAKQLLVSGKSRSFVRKKAALCLLRLFRKYQDCVPQDDLPPQILAILDDPNLGVVTSVLSLLLGLVSYSTAGYEEAPAKAIFLLAKLAFSKERKSVYRYYLTLCPWLQVKLLRLLQYFPPPGDKNVMGRLNSVLTDYLTKTLITKNANKNNADHAILFEAINVIIHYSQCGVKDLQGNAINLLGKFISIKEPNFRYLGLETMTKLAHVSGTLPLIRKHHDDVTKSLQDGDVSIRKRALDLLYVMCDKATAQDVVPVLLTYLQTATYEVREELVLKIAILAERFATDFKWYVDVILQCISLAGDFVTEDIWYRVVQIVTNNDDLQEYAATTCYKFLETGNVHENGVKVAAYILGEFGDQIKDQQISGQVLFELLHSKFRTSSNSTKALLLSAYIKMANTYPELKQPINSVFAQHRDSHDSELQQRACEYYVMSTQAPPALMDKVFEVMPNFNERESLLLKRMKKNVKQTTDRNVWNEGEEKKKHEMDDEDDDDDDDEDDDDEDEDDEDEDEEEDSDEDDEEGKARTAQTMDLLGGFGDFDPISNGGGGGGGGASVSFPAQDAAMLTSLYVKESGVVYETKDLQIGMKLSVENNNTARVVFYYGNRLPHSLTNLKASPQSSDVLRVAVQPEEAQEIPPKKQIQHFFTLTCMRPFKQPVPIPLSFGYQGKQHQLTVHVPVTVGRFCVGQQLEGAAFMNVWRQFGNEAQQTRKVDAQQTGQTLAQLAVDGLHLSVVHGVEKTQDNFVLAGTLHTASKNAQGGNVTMPILMRVESKSGMYRITVHSGHISVSEAVVQAFALVTGSKE